jgi:hypothetical protein
MVGRGWRRRAPLGGFHGIQIAKCGVFLPSLDETNRSETYGGGRYLLDTIKGADLGREGERLVIDFNYAYNPSCAYNSRWQCPLAPQENWLPVEKNPPRPPLIRGEKILA